MVSLSAIANIIFFSGVTTVVFLYVLLNSDVIVKIGVEFILALMVITVVRMFLPWEHLLQQNINITKIWPDIYVFLIQPIIHFGGKEFSLYNLFIIISIVGTVIYGIRFIRKYFKIRKEIEQLAIENNPVITRLINEINREQKKKGSFQLRYLYEMDSPGVFGVMTPYILIPRAELDSKELYYILLHEMTHFYSKDLWIKYICEILTAIYWWNPFVYLLRNQIANMLELRVDSKIVSHLDEERALEYMECLIKMTRLNTYVPQRVYTASFNTGKEFSIARRGELIIKEMKGEKKHTAKSIILVALLVLNVVFLPNLIIFEPYATDDKTASYAYDLNYSNTYYVLLGNGKYDVYVDHEYFGTVAEIFDESFAIYNEEGKKIK